MSSDTDGRRLLFETLAQNITDHGYSVHTNALPVCLCQRLLAQLRAIPVGSFRGAGIGRRGDVSELAPVRTDSIAWIDGTAEAGGDWLTWASALQAFLNERLYLGLLTFESHFAQYEKGAFYRQHQDSFAGGGNRILSILLYLNTSWVAGDAGELILYTGDKSDVAITVAPQSGTLVAFLSEEIPHEVLTTNAERLSIAGWFSVRN